MAASLSVAFDRLSPAAKQLLRLCAFAAPDPLPEQLFVTGAHLLPQELKTAAQDELAWDDVAGELQGYALAKREAIASLDRDWQAGGQVADGTPTELALSTHRLTQQVVRDRLAAESDNALVLLGVLAKGCPDDAQHPAQWPRLAALLPHAVWVNEADPIASLTDADLVIRQTWLLDRSASFLQFGLALLPVARVLFEKALAARRRVLGEEHPNTLTSMNNLASTLQAQGDLSGARSLQEQVLAALRRLQGEEDPNTLTSMGNLAYTLQAQGDLSGARSLQEQVLAARRRVLGEEHPDALTSMSDLAGTLWHQGAPNEAIALMQEAAKGSVAVLGIDHPHAKRFADKLAQMQRERG